MSKNLCEPCDGHFDLKQGEISEDEIYSFCKYVHKEDKKYEENIGPLQFLYNQLALIWKQLIVSAHL